MKRLPVGRRGGGHQALLLAAHQPRILAHTGHGLVSVSVSHLVAIAVTPNKYIKYRPMVLQCQAPLSTRL